MVCLQEKASGVSPQPWAEFTNHTDLKTKHFILKKKKKNQTVSLNMAYNQSPDPWCFIQLPQLPYEWAFNGTFITNNKHNGSCGGKSTRNCYMEEGLAVNPPGAPSFSCFNLRRPLHLLSYFVQTGFSSTLPYFFLLLTFLPPLSPLGEFMLIFDGHSSLYWCSMKAGISLHNGELSLREEQSAFGQWLLPWLHLLEAEWTWSSCLCSPCLSLLTCSNGENNKTSRIGEDENR